MPLFLVEHSWEKKDTPIIMKANTRAFIAMTAGGRTESLPETTKLIATYLLPGERAIDICEADKAETLENMFKALPMQTKITPIAQMYPAGPGLYAVISQMF